MVISVNSDLCQRAFSSLLNSTLLELNVHANDPSKKVAELQGRSLEPFVRDVMADIAIGTPFENSIELISGQKFPDIVAKKYFGVEVKTTKQNHWKTTGNSVLESTRVDNVERIYMLFAKLVSPIEFRCRLYEEVLSEVVVTHSPRYLIDMNLDQGKTIFDKIEIPYNVLRQKENPIKPIVDYYKSKLNPGEELWWMDTDNDSKASNMIIKIWSNISIEDRADLKNRAMVYFPELFGKSGHKFARLAVWLVTREAVVCPNVRDIFTAGGRKEYVLNGKVYKDVPRVFLNLFENIAFVLGTILETSSYELSEYWGLKTTEKGKVLDWINLVNKHAKNIPDAKHLDIKKILTSIMMI